MAPRGFEPLTPALRGQCSNQAELRSLPVAQRDIQFKKSLIFCEKYIFNHIFIFKYQKQLIPMETREESDETWSSNLWKFWEGLNRGEIDWKFIFNSDIPLKERGKSIDMLVKRGFVNLFDINNPPIYESRNWAVFDSQGNNITPIFDDKILYFRKDYYASAYIRHFLDPEEKLNYSVSDRFSYNLNLKGRKIE